MTVINVWGSQIFASDQPPHKDPLPDAYRNWGFSWTVNPVLGRRCTRYVMTPSWATPSYEQYLVNIPLLWNGTITDEVFPTGFQANLFIAPATSRNVVLWRDSGELSSNSRMVITSLGPDFWRVFLEGDWPLINNGFQDLTLEPVNVEGLISIGDVGPVSLSPVEWWYTVPYDY